MILKKCVALVVNFISLAWNKRPLVSHWSHQPSNSPEKVSLSNEDISVTTDNEHDPRHNSSSKIANSLAKPANSNIPQNNGRGLASANSAKPSVFSSLTASKEEVNQTEQGSKEEVNNPATPIICQIH